MTKIIFVCLGNICRSPMAEFVFREICTKKGVSDLFEISSAGTSDEEEGNPVHRGTVAKLSEHGISCEGKYARKLTVNELEYYDYIIIMDRANHRGVERIARQKIGLFDKISHKIKSLMSFTNRGGDIADPWYTGNFDETWQDVYDGCIGLYKTLEEEGLC